MDARQLGEDVSEFGGGKRDYGGVNPEYGVSALDLHISIFKVKRIVTSAYPFATGLSDVVV